jgi:magnesium transporter
MPEHTAGRALSRMSPHFGAECLKGLPSASAGGALETMPLDAAAALLRRLPKDERHRILEAAPPQAAAALSLLLRFPENTAGSLMDPGVLSVPEDITAEETLHRVRFSGARVSYYVYVIDRAGALGGVLSLRELMAGEPDLPISALMHREVARVSVHADRIAIRAHPGWLDYYALPVVDDANRLVGVLRYKTIRALEDALPTANRDPIAIGLALGEVYWSTMSQLVQSLWPGGPERPTPSEEPHGQ